MFIQMTIKSKFTKIPLLKKKKFLKQNTGNVKLRPQAADTTCVHVAIYFRIWLFFVRSLQEMSNISISQVSENNDNPSGYYHHGYN